MKIIDRVIDYVADRVLDRMQERRAKASHNFHIVNNTVNKSASPDQIGEWREGLADALNAISLRKASSE